MKSRDEIEGQYKWDFKQVYSSDEEWHQDCERVREDLEKIKKMEGSVLDSSDSFYKVLELREDILRRIDKLGMYARMRKHIDMSNSEYQKASSVADALRTDVSYELSFLRPEIINQKEKASNYLEEDERLEKYRQYLDRMFRLEDHTRSKEVEEVISKMSELMSAPRTNYSMLVNADIEFPVVEKSDGGEVKISLSNFGKLLKDEDPEFRKEVYDKFYECLGGYSNTIASSLEATIKKNQRLAELRNYKSAKHSSLKSSNIPVEIYDNLLEVAEDNLDALHSHIEMKDEGFDHQIRMCDIARPMEGGEELEISYEEAKEIVLEALKPLGEEYVEVAEKGLNSERWVDVYESENKRSGAYSSGYMILSLTS